MTHKDTQLQDQLNAAAAADRWDREFKRLHLKLILIMASPFAAIIIIALFFTLTHW